MNLRDLQYVSAIAEQGSFTRAAQIASVSQPALSNQIKKLEAELGHAIFVRAQNEVRLTSFGEALLLHVKDIQQSVVDIANLAKQHGQEKVDTIRIGTTPTLAPYIGACLRQIFDQLYPAERLIISEAYPDALTDMIADRTIDIAIVAQKSFRTIQSSRSATMQFSPLWDEVLYLAMREGHPLAANEAIYAHDVPASQLIRFAISFGYDLEARLPDPTSEASDLAGIDMKTARFETVCRQLAHCDACTIVNAVAAEKLKKDENSLSFIPFQDQDNYRVLGAMTCKQDGKTDVVEKLRQFSLNVSPLGTTPAK